MNRALSSTDTVIRSTSTGLLSTEVHAVDGSYVWVHRIGPGAALPFSDLPIAIDPAADTALVTVGRGNDDHRSYSTVAGSMVFELLVAGESLNLRAAGRRWGEALRSLHENASVSGDSTDRPPRTIRRAKGWIDGNWRAAREVLSEHGLQEIRRWISLVLSCPHPAVVHGHPGMAHWVVTDDGDGGALLTGEDAGLADPVYDIAWVLGEIAELHAFHPASRPVLDQLRTGFLETCGPVPGPSELGPALAFRIAQHAYDWHHYAGAGEEQAKVLLRLAATYLHHDQDPS